MHKIIRVNETTRITINQDLDSGLNPRTDYDNLGTIKAWHRRYILGDINNQGDLLEELKMHQANQDLVMPLYMLDHSGISLSTSDFNDSWDSGLLGFIFVSKETLAKEGLDETQAKQCIRSELNTYNDYLAGNMWYFTVETWNPTPDCGWEVVDSLGGFIGDLDTSGLLDEILNFVDAKDHDKVNEEVLR